MDCPACHTTNIEGARFCAKCGALLPVQVAEGADPLINQVVGGRFRITGVLGEGGMGRVYFGEQQMGTSVRKVAVKVLLAQYAKDPQVVARFQRECGTVAELEHPNTIRFYDFGTTPDGDLYIAMELLNGQSLEEALEKGGPLASERVDRIMGQVCGSLEEAHDKGIIHRDLKPANIFLTKRGGEDDYVKVLDFGIARRDDRNSKAEQKLTQQGTVLGTPPYMSPEQFMGKELTIRSDIYSLGVVTYEMLTGRLPFDADTPWAWATQHMTAQPFPFDATQLGAAAPPKMKAAIMRALSKKPEERPATVREFYEELTLGAGPRLSVLASTPQTSTSQMPAAGSTGARPGGTQIGEPLFVGAPPGAAGRTIMEPGPITGSAPAVPAATGSAQVYPAPPTTSKPQKSNAPLIAGGAVIAVLGLIGVVFLVKGSGKDDGGGTPLPIPTATASAVTVASDPVPTSEPSATPTAEPTAQNKAPSSGAGSQGSQSGSGTQTAGASAAADEACRAAMNLAAGGHTARAVTYYAKCDGPSKAAARSAIDGSARRAVASKGCKARSDAEAAAKIGATGAMADLKKKKCL
ncbi:MAG TPA: protein kinase [Candidatus Nanopelagicales bacterium]|nr:protein kinase [Candidatus Nanopelagicales bacterium]